MLLDFLANILVIPLIFLLHLHIISIEMWHDNTSKFSMEVVTWKSNEIAI